MTKRISMNVVPEFMSGEHDQLYVTDDDLSNDEIFYSPRCDGSLNEIL